MTVMGKILVIVNLVFSLLTAFLIMMVYTARTNWAEAYKKLEANYQAAQSNAVTFNTDAQESKKQADTRVNAAEAEVKTLKGELDVAKKDGQANLAKFEAASRENQVAKVNADTLAEELKRRQLEVDAMKGREAENNKRMVQLEDQAKAFRDRAVEAEIASKSMQDRNDNLRVQLENMTKDLERARTGGGTGVASASQGKNPPQADIEGTVKDVDAQSGLITISIGSDSGIARGNTLEVFRLRPAEYLGTIRIVDVRPNEAVGKAVTQQRRGQIQVGDRVASSILSKRL
jgi:hypothetical protein